MNNRTVTAAVVPVVKTDGNAGVPLAGHRLAGHDGQGPAVWHLRLRRSSLLGGCLAHPLPDHPRPRVRLRGGRSRLLGVSRAPRRQGRRQGRRGAGHPLLGVLLVQAWAVQPVHPGWAGRTGVRLQYPDDALAEPVGRLRGVSCTCPTRPLSIPLSGQRGPHGGRIHRAPVSRGSGRQPGQEPSARRCRGGRRRRHHRPHAEHRGKSGRGSIRSYCSARATAGSTLPWR